MTQSSGQDAADPHAAAGQAPSLPPPGKSLAEMVAAPRAGSFAESFPPETLIKMGVLAGLLLLLNYRHVGWLAKKWVSDSDWSHGFVIPLFSIYLLYSRREDLLSARRKTSLVGLAILLACLIGEIIGYYPVRNYWLSQVCMVGVLFGLVLYLAGASTVRVTWLPILFLIFAVPISPRIYTRISVPLQNIAASGSVVFLRLLGVQITSSASSLEMISRSGVTQQMTVAEACSGMKLLMAFGALGVAMAYLDYKPIWQRAILVAAAVPIAVFCNVIRVAITAWMFYIDKPELGQDFMHRFTGMLMLVPAFALLWLLSWILRRIFVEEADESAGPLVAEEAA